MNVTETDSPLAIAMWDFSWLERRYPGGGYNDWDTALDELAERGYNAVRIDAYPHLVARDPEREWTLPPAFDACDWGAPTRTTVRVEPALTEFIRKCAEKDIEVALSTWFRKDSETDARMGIRTPDDLAHVWIETLERVEDAGLLDAITYVDLNNEFPGQRWAPHFNRPGDQHPVDRASPASKRWIRESIETVRESYPDQDYCMSEIPDLDRWETLPVENQDFIEAHIWLMTCGEFYDWELFDDIDSEEHFGWLVETAEERYRSDPERWQSVLGEAIQSAAEWSREAGVPVGTTECWSIINYRDHPQLDWDWVKEVCAFGTREAADTGRWAAISTSNFCGPQFSGMWDDVEWHRDLTDTIKSAEIERNLR